MHPLPRRAAGGFATQGEAVAFALGGNRKMLRTGNLAGLLNQQLAAAGQKTAEVCRHPAPSSADMVGLGVQKVAAVLAASETYSCTALMLELGLQELQDQQLQIRMACPGCLWSVAPSLATHCPAVEFLLPPHLLTGGAAYGAASTHEQISNTRPRHAKQPCNRW